MSLATESRLAAETYLWGLQGICQLHRIPFAAGLVLQQFPPPHDLPSLQRAASTLGLNGGMRDATSCAELPDLPTSFVAVLVPVRATEGADPGPHRIAIVIRCKGGGITYLEEGRQHPVTATLCQFGSQ